MTQRDHLGEDAALYALGMLDESERIAVEEHAAACDACARLLAAASDDVTAMVVAQNDAETSNVVSLSSARSARPAWTRFLAAAVAAAFVIGFVPTAYFWQQNQSMQRHMADEANAMQRVMTTPHNDVAFGNMSGGSAANVMYGRDGSWYVVVVRGATRALQVAWMHDGQKTMLGTAEPYGDLAMLYLPKSHRMDRLALMDGETVVAEAELAY